MLDRFALAAIMRGIFRNGMESVNVHLAIERSTIPSSIEKSRDGIEAQSKHLPWSF